MQNIEVEIQKKNCISVNAQFSLLDLVCHFFGKNFVCRGGVPIVKQKKSRYKIKIKTFPGPIAFIRTSHNASKSLTLPISTFEIIFDGPCGYIDHHSCPLQHFSEIKIL